MAQLGPLKQSSHFDWDITVMDRLHYNEVMLYTSVHEIGP